MNPLAPRCPLIFFFAAISFAIAAHPAPAPDDEARFLAGLPVQYTPLEPLSHTAAWTAHSIDFDHAWAELDKHQLDPIHAWAPKALDYLYTESTPVYYLFSGPDFLYAHAFFPNASTYVLCGIEPIGPLPRVEEIPAQTLGPSLTNLRQSLTTLLDFSFFITKRMHTDLEDSRLTGTLPLLYVFLARSGCTIREVTFTGVDVKGRFTTTGRSLAPAVKILFSGPSGKDQTLYYFSTDLSDDTVGRSGFLAWCAGLGEGRGFLKAASYLMHNGEFVGARQFLLSHCAAILEDDSGVPMRFFGAADWNIHLFGNYRGPIETFKQYRQAEIDQLMLAQRPEPLPFSVGYRWRPGESGLILAVKNTHAGP